MSIYRDAAEKLLPTLVDTARIAVDNHEHNEKCRAEWVAANRKTTDILAPRQGRELSWKPSYAVVDAPWGPLRVWAFEREVVLCPTAERDPKIVVLRFDKATGEFTPHPSEDKDMVGLVALALRRQARGRG